MESGTASIKSKSIGQSPLSRYKTRRVGYNLCTLIKMVWHGVSYNEITSICNQMLVIDIQKAIQTHLRFTNPLIKSTINWLLIPL